MRSRSLRYRTIPRDNTDPRMGIKPRRRCRPWFVFLPRLGMGGFR